MPTNLPADIRSWAAKRYANQHKGWLNGEGVFPQSTSLGSLTEKGFMEAPAVARQWHDAWRSWAGCGVVEWAQVHWPRAGSHQLPQRLVFASPADIAEMAGKQQDWGIAQSRITLLTNLMPVPASGMGRFYDLVLSYSAPEWAKLVCCLQYFLANPNSGLYVRQLPIAGVDTKWVEAHKSDLTKLIKHIKNIGGDSDFYDVCGLRRPAHRVRVRLLCPTLRAQLGGVGDLQVPVADIAAWSTRPTRILVIENQESGTALEDMPDTMAFIGMGYSVSALASIPWLAGVPGLYWGDLDTHGLAIFNCAKRVLPQLNPVLMDTATLFAYQDLWVPEPSQQVQVSDLPAAQAEAFSVLTSPGVAQGMRLEQERIPWAVAWRALTD